MRYKAENRYKKQRKQEARRYTASGSGGSGDDASR
jgi:hypothetical protein